VINIDGRLRLACTRFGAKIRRDVLPNPFHLGSKHAFDALHVDYALRLVPDMVQQRSYVVLTNPDLVRGGSEGSSQIVHWGA
jgi:hypothetical protein